MQNLYTSHHQLCTLLAFLISIKIHSVCSNLIAQLHCLEAKKETSIWNMIYYFSFWAVAKLCSKRKAVCAPHYIAILCVKQGHFLYSGTELLAMKKVIIIQVSHLLLATDCMSAVSSGYRGIFSCAGKDGGAEVSKMSHSASILSHTTINILLLPWSQLDNL